MIGDAYFQLRAQVGTALFSLLRLAADADVAESTLTALRTAQVGLRSPFHVLALGGKGSGKSTLLNTLFEREFCGAAEPGLAGKTAIFQRGEGGNDVAVAEDTVICERPHIFLRDFTVIDAAPLESSGNGLQDAFVSYLPRADVFFFVVPATSGVAANVWEYLPRLGRELLKRVVFVVWQSDRVPPKDVANAVKRLRQAMLKSLGQACPIFAASAQEEVGRAKLVRWVENEIIFSASRRAGLLEIERLAQAALRDIADKPRVAEQAWQRTAGQLHDLQEDLTEREEQSQRQVAGVLWTVAQGCDALRLYGESLLRPHLGIGVLLRGGGRWPADFARDIETQARESLVGQTEEAVEVLEADLREAAKEYQEGSREWLLEEDAASLPQFPRAAVERSLRNLEKPLDLQRMLEMESARVRGLLLLPALAAVGATAVTVGTWLAMGLVVECALLAAGALVIVLVQAVLLRNSIVARFGEHLTANRAALLAAMEPVLREASTEFYGALAKPLETKVAAHEVERRQHEPLLERVAQLQQTFAKIGEDLRAQTAPAPEES